MAARRIAPSTAARRTARRSARPPASASARMAYARCCRAHARCRAEGAGNARLKYAPRYARNMACSTGVTRYARLLSAARDRSEGEKYAG